MIASQFFYLPQITQMFADTFQMALLSDYFHSKSAKVHAKFVKKKELKKIKHLCIRG
jgi:hypothetical protein